jgi:hypothetical protein
MKKDSDPITKLAGIILGGAFLYLFYVLLNTL